jgi:hypothetical protein
MVAKGQEDKKKTLAAQREEANLEILEGDPHSCSASVSGTNGLQTHFRYLIGVEL